MAKDDYYATADLIEGDSLVRPLASNCCGNGDSDPHGISRALSMSNVTSVRTTGGFAEKSCVGHAELECLGGVYHEQVEICRGLSMANILDPTIKDTSAEVSSPFNNLEESLVWHRALDCSGDFYYEPDDIYRGVTMSCIADAVMTDTLTDNSSITKPPGVSLTGNPTLNCLEDVCYKSDDLYRGVSTSNASTTVIKDVCTDTLPPPIWHDALDNSGDAYHEPVDICHAQSTSKASYVKADDVFAEGSSPPKQPTDEFFELACTTAMVNKSARPHEIMRCLLLFLQTFAGFSSTIRKIGEQKFTLKANVNHKEMVCLLKIRLYETESGMYAIEFQRRQGDCICFVSIFSLALEHLRACFKKVESFRELGCGLPTSCTDDNFSSKLSRLAAPPASLPSV